MGKLKPEKILADIYLYKVVEIKVTDWQNRLKMEKIAEDENFYSVEYRKRNTICLINHS